MDSHCQSIYHGKQVQEVYTTAKFKKFQAELTGKMYCHVLNLNNYGALSEYEVSEDFLIRDTIEEKGEECEIKCVCLLFELRGILCHHAIAVLILEGIYSMPTKYITRNGGKT